MKRVAADLAQAAPTLDILINNAGAIVPTRQTTVDGLERSFALNHLAYVVTTLGLLDQLKAAPQGRVICTSSRLHATHKLDFDDLQLEGRYDAYAAYGRSKLANILFVRALARRLAGTAVTVNAVHPGFVRTAMGDDDVSVMGRVFSWMKFMALSPEAGARTTLHAALSEEGGRLSGAYFVKEKLAQPSAAAQDDATAERLWAESLRLADLADPTPPVR
jgi:NAD(P)-dependent dehydrogenase (short-subunit alcohol dehydrogenase family)